MSYTPIPNPLPVSGTVSLPDQQNSEIQSLQETMRLVLVELKLLNLHLHELPRALNEGYFYAEDDESIRTQLLEEE